MHFEGRPNRLRVGMRRREESVKTKRKKIIGWMDIGVGERFASVNFKIVVFISHGKA